MKKIKNFKKVFVAFLVALSLLITVSAVDSLVPLGHTAGIKLSSRGAMVVSLATSDADNPCRLAGIGPGDIIRSVDEKEISGNRDLREIVLKCEGKSLSVEYQRGEETKKCTITPRLGDNGEYSIGVFIRDSIAGIGTMTYYDPETKSYGALGHGVCDGETNSIIPVDHGSLMGSSVREVKQGKSGQPGELCGDYEAKDEFATIEKNTNSGIFGKVKNEESLHIGREAYPVAKKDEIKKGKATILSNIEGDGVCEYEIEITAISKNGEKTKNMMIRAVDPKLLSKTGGIVRGMSGSPIIQNGKIVGAVTHVLVNDPTRGYAIFIENMLDAAA